MSDNCPNVQDQSLALQLPPPFAFPESEQSSLLDVVEFRQVFPPLQ
jgi:hypothetical protein